MQNYEMPQHRKKRTFDSMRIHSIQLIILAFALISMGACKSQEQTSSDDEMVYPAVQTLYVMTRVNKVENDITLVDAEHRIEAFQNPGQFGEENENWDQMRCSLFDQSGKLIQTQFRKADLKYDGAESGKDAIVQFYIPFPTNAVQCIVSYEILPDTWQEVYSTPLP